jgi:tetratricopeptide (TPR) repeat protein
MGCCGSKEHVTKPVPQPEKPRAQAPAPPPAVPTAGQLEIATPAHNTSPEPPAMPPTEEQAAERPAQLKRLATLPEHLQLGVTLAGMRELLLKLPSDALEQVNAQIPLDKKTGEPKFPTNDTFNGYASQYFMNLWAKEPKEGQPEGDGLAVCERLREQGSPHVGKATVFVSWFLATTIETLLDALANFLEQQGLREDDTFFWVCDYVIRQTNVGPDLKLLGECVSAVGHTVLLMEPWHAPAPLKRAYCIKEVYYTQKSGARFDVVMSSAQQAAFEAALRRDFGSIQASLSKVDVRTATCRNEKDTKAILDELEQGVGFVACNTLVLGLLREALVAQARAALERLPAAERGTSALIGNMGSLLQNMGKLEEAMPLYEEALQVRRAALGDRHPGTLASINNMGMLLQKMGKLEEARPLYEEALQACRETLGNRHPRTLISISNMGGLLQGMGKLEEAKPLYQEAVQARRETLGDRHPGTLSSIGNMGLLLKEMGKLEEARPLYEEALQATRETLGDRHPSTLISIDNMGQLLQAMGKLEEARLLVEEALQASRETLGDRHPDTLISISNMGNLLQNMGKLEEARPLLEEAMQGCRETLGNRHLGTLASIGYMADLLRATGSLAEAELVLDNTVPVVQEVLGNDHATTLKITAIAARLQHAQPGGAVAGKELLAATVARMVKVLGESHAQTGKYQKVLTEME